MDEDQLGPVEGESGDSQAAGTEPQQMGALLEEAERRHHALRRGDVVEGVVVRVDHDEALVDIGAKSEAVIPAREMPHGRGGTPLVPDVGEQIVAYVLNPEDSDGRTVLSLSKAQSERNWRELQKQFESGQLLEGAVVEHNKGGLIVSVLGIRGFLPLSQIVDLRRGGPEENVEDRLAAMRGRQTWVKIIEMNRRRNRLILSERAAIQERRQREKERLLEELKPGDVRHGMVTSITDFGAFVDIGGADGLIHLSELTWGQVTHPSQVLKVGQEVDVYVVGVDRETRKIALSLKRLEAEPWARVAEKYEIGQEVSGKITKLANFGAFAEIEAGIEGLIHITELSTQHITHPRQVVREGDLVTVKIIRLDPARRRLGLSMR